MGVCEMTRGGGGAISTSEFKAIEALLILAEGRQLEALLADEELGEQAGGQNPQGKGEKKEGEIKQTVCNFPLMNRKKQTSLQWLHTTFAELTGAKREVGGLGENVPHWGPQNC